MKLIWAMLGLLAMALAIIGVVLPLLPTVPFLLLAAFCFARSSQKLHRWLISHKTFRPDDHCVDHFWCYWPNRKALCNTVNTGSVLAIYSHWAKLEHINPTRSRPELCSWLYLDPTAPLGAA